MLDRTSRILLRAKNYAEGKIDLETFFNLETLDEMAEPAGEPDEPTPAAVPQKQEPAQPEPQEKPKKATAKNRGQKNALNITKEDFNSLRLFEQQELYNENPDAVKELIEQEA